MSLRWWVSTVSGALTAVIAAAPVVAGFAGSDVFLPMAGRQAGVPASFAIGLGERSRILGAHQTQPATDSEYRFNFGAVETTGHSAWVRVRALDGNGEEQGRTEFQVREWSQRQVAFKDHFPTVSTENSRLEVEVISGEGKVIAYGSGIANGSQDPTTFEMEYPQRVLAGEAVSGLEGVAAGAGLAGGGNAGIVVVNVGAGAGIRVDADSVAIADDGVATEMVADGAITAAKIGTAGATSGQVLTATLSGAAWQSAAAGAGGDITAVAAGAGLAGGGASGDVLVAVPGLHVAEEIRENRFRIAGGPAGAKVSWHVGGVRKDAWAVAHPMAVEPEKGAVERGYYRHPELYGQPIERGVEWAQSHALSSAGPGVSPESGKE